MRIEKEVANAADGNLVDADFIRLVDIAFPQCFKEARLSTTGSSGDFELNENVGQVSNIMRALTSKDGDLLLHFDKYVESRDEIGSTPLKHHLILNHDIPTIKGKMKRPLPLEHLSRFCRTFRKITKQLGFHLSSKTADLQDIICTTLG